MGTKTIHVFNRVQLEEVGLERTSDVISIRDPLTRPVQVKNPEMVRHRLDLEFHDITTYVPYLQYAKDEDFHRILQFAARSQDTDLVIQCEAGVGRSQAIAIALLELSGMPVIPMKLLGPYNTYIYESLLSMAGIKTPKQPLVSMVVRKKYRLDKLKGLMASLMAQRHTRWEAIIVVEGRLSEQIAFSLYSALSLGQPRVQIIEAKEYRGLWGHPHRQQGINNCNGDYIGLTNDDNYYAPGYFEQMLLTMELEGTSIAMCDMVHSYRNWAYVQADPTGANQDLGCWLAKAELVENTPFNGTDFNYDKKYLQELIKKVDGKVSVVPRPLFVHN